jgi:hypothetical protein
VLTTPQQPPINSIIPNPQYQSSVLLPKLPPPGLSLPGLPLFGSLPPLSKLPPLPNLPGLPPLPNLSNLPPLPNLPNLPPLPNLPGMPKLPPLPGMLPVFPPMMSPPDMSLLGKRQIPKSESSESLSSDSEKKIKDENLH